MRNNQIRKTKSTIKAEVAILIIKETDTYLAFCPALNLSSYGKTEKKALRAFASALNIFFEESDRKGTLEKLLLKLGWSLQHHPHPVYEPPRLNTAQLNKLFSSTERVVTEEIAVPAY